MNTPRKYPDRRPARGVPACTPRILSYRLIDFRQDAPTYSKHLLGAVTGYYYDHWIKVVHLVKSLENAGDLVSRLDMIEKEFSFYIGFIRGPYPESVIRFNAALDGGRKRAARRGAKAFHSQAAVILRSCRGFIDDAVALLAAGNTHPQAIASLEAHLPPLEQVVKDFKLG